MSDRLTVYEIANAGKVMVETQHKIKNILEDSGLSTLNRTILLDLMAFDLKLKSSEVSRK